MKLLLIAIALVLMLLASLVAFLFLAGRRSGS